MASIISAGTTSATALNMSADTSGVLQLASNNGTVGVTLSTAQNLLVGSTTDNGYKLKVVGGNASNLLIDNGGQQYTQLLLQRNGTANTGGDILIDGSASAMNIRGLLAGPMIFQTSASAGSPAEALRIDIYGNTLLGGTTGLGASGGRLAVYGTSGGQNGFIQVTNPGYGTGVLGIQGTSSNFKIYNSYSAGTFSGGVGIDITTAGDVCINSTVSNASGLSNGYLKIDMGNVSRNGFVIDNVTQSYSAIAMRKQSATGTMYPVYVVNSSGSYVGAMTASNTGVTYDTASDYRLKENIAPMTGALAKVSALKPVTYTWKLDGSKGQGFIAHELQEVVPDCVSGEKDATKIEQYEISPAVPAVCDKEGNVLTPEIPAVMGEREVPVYQGIDTSFLVATLTAAIQELNDKVTALEVK